MLRWFAVLVEIVICFLLQSTAMPAASLAGVFPDLLMIVVITVAYTRGNIAGMLTGFCAGILSDVCFNEIIGVCALLYLSVGFLAGYSEKIYQSRNLLLPLALIGAGELVYSFGYYVVYFLLRSRIFAGYYLVHLIIPRILYTVLAAIPLYLLLHGLHRLFLRMEYGGES